MLQAPASPADKRRAFRHRLASGDLLVLPGAMNPLSAMLIEEHGFDGVYV
jgi:methylisocitrate lyase